MQQSLKLLLYNMLNIGHSQSLKLYKAKNILHNKKEVKCWAVKATQMDCPAVMSLDMPLLRGL